MRRTTLFRLQFIPPRIQVLTLRARYRPLQKNHQHDYQSYFRVRGILSNIKSMREIEIKLKVKDFTEIEKQLVERGCVLSKPFAQHDVIYSEGGSTEEWRHAKDGDKVVRIRRS